MEWSDILMIEMILLVVLILLNAMFAASELAFLSLNKLKLEKKVKEKNKKARRIKELIDNPSSFLATIQIGITLAGFLASAFASETFADQIVASITYVPISRTLLKGIIVILVTTILSYFTLIFGELVPKRLALTYPEKVAYAVVNLIYILKKVAYPFVWFLTKSTNFITKLLKIPEHAEEKITEEEIKSIILKGKKEGSIESGETEMILNIFKFNDITAEEVMTKRDLVVAVDIYTSHKALLNIIRKSKYTRIPVYQEKLDSIVGIINVKDLIMQYSKETTFSLKDIMNEPLFVQAEEKIDDVFHRMQSQRQVMAIVMKKNRMVGVLTLEDAIEEILGNIYDEYVKEAEE